MYYGYGRMVDVFNQLETIFPSKNGRTTLTPTQTKRFWMIVPVGNQLAIDNSINHKGVQRVSTNRNADGMG